MNNTLQNKPLGQYQHLFMLTKVHSSIQSRQHLTNASNYITSLLPPTLGTEKHKVFQKQGHSVAFHLNFIHLINQTALNYLSPPPHSPHSDIINYYELIHIS